MSMQGLDVLVLETIRYLRMLARSPEISACLRSAFTTLGNILGNIARRIWRGVKCVAKAVAKALVSAFNKCQQIVWGFFGFDLKEAMKVAEIERAIGKLNEDLNEVYAHMNSSNEAAANAKCCVAIVQLESVIQLLQEGQNTAKGDNKLASAGLGIGIGSATFCGAAFWAAQVGAVATGAVAAAIAGPALLGAGAMYVYYKRNQNKINAESKFQARKLRGEIVRMKVAIQLLNAQYGVVCSEEDIQALDDEIQTQYELY